MEPRSYGSFVLVSATLLELPVEDPSGQPVPPALTAGKRAPRVLYKSFNTRGSRIARVQRPQRQTVLQPTRARSKIVKPMTAFGSVAVLDVGMASSNVLLAPDGTPRAYFDVGAPMSRYGQTRPAPLQEAKPVVLRTAAMFVVLSHWDWDHWYLGYLADLHDLEWLYPNQAIGGVTHNIFQKRLRKIGNACERKRGAFVWKGLSLYRCGPGKNQGPMPPNRRMNNTGIALAIELAVTDEREPKQMVLPADANFEYFDYKKTDIVAITAVHHGSSNNGALDEVPRPYKNVAGHVLYSYGLSIDGSTASYAYGFPTEAARQAYTKAKWGVECSTAETTALRPKKATLAKRGNIRIGVDNGVGINERGLDKKYKGSVFASFTQQIVLTTKKG